jgi:hypothetical protein
MEDDEDNEDQDKDKDKCRRSDPRPLIFRSFLRP